MLVSEAVGRTVHALGGDVVFGLMGSGNLAVTNAIVAAGGRFFSARHETGAVCMADGYSRVSGKLGVASVHQGPGLTNAITGLTEAAKSRTPVLLLSADTPPAQLRSNFKIDQDALIESVGAVSERVHSPATAVADTARAVRRAHAGAPHRRPEPAAGRPGRRGRARRHRPRCPTSRPSCRPISRRWSRRSTPRPARRSSRAAARSCPTPALRSARSASGSAPCWPPPRSPTACSPATRSTSASPAASPRRSPRRS